MENQDDCNAPGKLSLRGDKLGCDFFHRMDETRKKIKERSPARCGVIPNEEVILEMVGGKPNP